jgi:hypothetical protein
MALATALATLLVARGQGTTVAAVVTLYPACALGVVFGAGGMIPLALVLALGLLVRRRGLRVATLTLGLGVLAVALPLLLPFPSEFARWLLAPRPLSPGISLSNLLYYRPGHEATGMALLRCAGPASLGLLAILLLRSRRARSMPWALLGTVAGAALVLLPSVPAHASAAPIVLLAIASMAEPPESPAPESGVGMRAAA